MIFNSFLFLWLFPIIFCIYLFIRSNRLRRLYPRMGNAFLLLISYLLYIKWNPAYSLILFGVTFVTYYVALKIEKDNVLSKKKYLICCGITLATLPLLVFKYYNFLTQTAEVVLGWVGVEVGLPGLNWAMPLGISFYTFQAIGYLVDVYLCRIKAERNWWDYMLFVSFFPQIASGPISKAADLLPQIKANRQFNEQQFVQGCKWLLWGMFLKVVVADRIALNVNDVYIHMQTNGGFTLLMASVMYSMQIYCDFAGYSFMAVGVGEILGFELINNFSRPYFSQSVTEFWHRWHISLSIWLKDYVYIPLGGSRCSKVRNYWNIMITFLVSGLWHGANWTFVVWGGLHGLFQVIEKAIGLNKKISTGILKLTRIIVVFLFVTFTWIFFRMPTFGDAFYVICKIFTNHQGAFSQWTASILFALIVIFKDTTDEMNINKMRLFHSKYILVRWSTYMLLVFMIMAFGVYGGQFIYSGF